MVSNLQETVQVNIRMTDEVSLMGEHSVALVLQETSRQAAEITAKRISANGKRISKGVDTRQSSN
ncbi:MAG: hypothetical protein ACE5K8_07510 [Candidatus Zixiibacteriota bacterium]